MVFMLVWVQVWQKSYRFILSSSSFNLAGIQSSFLSPYVQCIFGGMILPFRSLSDFKSLQKFAQCLCDENR